jgi:hypothetical protein
VLNYIYIYITAKCYGYSFWSAMCIPDPSVYYKRQSLAPKAREHAGAETSDILLSLHVCLSSIMFPLIIASSTYDSPFQIFLVTCTICKGTAGSCLQRVSKHERISALRNTGQSNVHLVWGSEIRRLSVKFQTSGNRRATVLEDWRCNSRELGCWWASGLNGVTTVRLATP